MKQRAVFLFYHGLSHVIAVLEIARLLQRSGYDVYFAGAEFFQHYIIAQGFKFKKLTSVPFGLGFENWVRTVEKGKNIFLSALRDRITDRLYNDRKVDLYWMLEELNPSVVFIDSRQATDFIVLYRYLKERLINVAIHHAMLPATADAFHPPLNSEVFPDDPAALKNAINGMKWKSFKNSLMKKLLYCGFDDLFLINRRLKKNGVPAHYVSKDPSLLKFTLRNVDEFILAPREFDFPAPRQSQHQHFIGFMTNQHYDTETRSKYTEVWPRILDVKQTHQAPLIFCSFGTITPGDTGILSSFIKKLIQASAKEGHLLVIAAKGIPKEVATLAANDRVYIFDFVPQLQVLMHADVFITHGGLNSIREGVHAELPMLLYPIHSEYDPIGNAARIVYHKLGLRGSAYSDTALEIANKVKEVLSNPVYKANVQKLKRQDAIYSGDNFLRILSVIKPLSK